MKNFRYLLLAGLLVFTLGAATAANAVPKPPIAAPTDPGPLYQTLTSADDRAFVNVLGRPDGGEMVYRITGFAYTRVPGNALAPALPHGRKLWGVEGYNIRRLVRIPNTDDIVLLSREIVFYTDPATGAIAKTWTNPLDGKTRPVVPIANDYVAFKYRIKGGKLYALVGPTNIEVPAPAPTRIHDERVWTSDIPPIATMAQDQIPENFGLANDVYTAWELFDFYVDDIEYIKRTPAHYTPTGAMKVKNSWTRNSPWIPGMCIAEKDKPGGMTYHARSYTKGGFNDLDTWIRNEVNTNFPAYKSAPTEVLNQRNVTSWTAFYRNQLAPKGWSWQQWCDNTAS